MHFLQSLDLALMVLLVFLLHQKEDFVKIEITLDDNEKVGEGQRKLEELLAEFGLSENERLKETYADLA